MGRSFIVIRKTSDMTVVVIETERAQIREFKRGDIHDLSKILSDPDVMEFSSKGPLTEADTLNFINGCINSYQENGYGQWAVIGKESGRLIGYCGLSQAIVDHSAEVEIGYRLSREHWGMGLASEAVSGVLAHGFKRCNIESIVGIVSPRHSASIRVLEKVGFRNFFEARYCGWDVRIYRLTNKDS